MTTATRPAPVTTAVAYGPDRPSAKPGVRVATLAEVIVHSDPDVADHEPVQVEIIGAGHGDWEGKAGTRMTVDRVQLGHLRRPGYDGKAVLAARLAMSSLATTMVDHQLRSTDPVSYWNLRASMDDLRAALCLAAGIPLDRVRRDGYMTPA